MVENDWDAMFAKRFYIDGDEDFFHYPTSMKHVQQICAQIVNGRIAGASFKLRNGQIIRVKKKEGK